MSEQTPTFQELGIQPALVATLASIGIEIPTASNAGNSSSIRRTTYQLVAPPGTGLQTWLRLVGLIHAVSLITPDAEPQ